MADFAREGPERGDLNWEAALGVHLFVAEGLARGGMGTTARSGCLGKLGSISLPPNNLTPSSSTGGSSWLLDELFMKGDLKGFFSF